MNDNVRLEWQYTPQDYFEAPWSFHMGLIRIEIADGLVAAHVPAVLYDQNEQIRDEIYKQVNDRFLGAQIINHKP
jgi:hypothetical protein